MSSSPIPTSSEPREAVGPGSRRARATLRVLAAALCFVLSSAAASASVGSSLASPSPSPERSEQGQQAQHDPEAHRQLGRVQELLQEGRVEAAHELLRAALQKDPLHAEAWTLLGRIAQQGGAVEEAVESYRRALSVDPDLVPAWLNVGVVFLDTGRFEQAAAAFREATDRQADNADAWRGLGLAHLRSGRAAAAVEALRRSDSLAPGSPDTLKALSEALVDAGDLEAAEGAVRRALELLPDDPDLRLLQARITARDDREAAVERLRQLVEDHPDHVDAWVEMGELYMASEDRSQEAKAPAALRRAHELASDDVSVHRKLVEAYWNLGFEEDVERELDILLERHPENAGTWIVLGNYHYSRQRFSRAVDAYDRALSLGSDRPVAHLRRAQALEKLLRPEAARDAFRRSLELDPDLSEAALGIARTSLAIGEPRSALDALEGVSGPAGDPEAPRLRGEAYLKLQDHAAAVEQLRAAVDRDPRDRNAWSLLARALQASGDPQAADRALEEARSIWRQEPEDRARTVPTGLPKRGRHFRLRGRVYLDEGRTEEALEYLRKAKLYLPDDPELERLTERARRKLGPRLGPWVDVAPSTGVTPVNRSGTPEKRLIVETTGSGVGWLDFDRDGRLDLFLANGNEIRYVPFGEGGNAIEVTGRPPDALMRQRTDGGFADVAAGAGVGDTGWAGGVAVGDVDNDGWQDLYLTHFGENRLYRNNGDGTFTEITGPAGAGDPRWSSTAALADWDEDGFLDLYVANYTVFDPDSPPYDGRMVCHFVGISTPCGPTGLEGETDLLLWNAGDGTFDPVDQGRIADAAFYGLGVMPYDANDDGLLDIYVANDTSPNFLFVNRGGREFSEEALLYGLAYSGDGRAQAGMGIAAGDIGNDGRADLMVTNFSHDTNTLYQNTEGQPFEDVTQRLGLGSATYSYLGWGVLFRDFDLDGDLDAFIANGHVYPQVDDNDLDTSYDQRNQVFANVDGRLHEVGDPGPGLEIARSSRGAAAADYDRDGDEDVAVSNIDSVPALLRNDQPRGNRWVQLRLVGRKSNRDGIGAAVTLQTTAGERVRTVRGAAGYMSSQDPTLVFGLGASGEVTGARVKWPSGREDRLSSLEAGRLHLVVERVGVVARE